MGAYDHKQGVLTINGVRIEGFADATDAFMLEPDSEAGERTTGADGRSVWIVNNNGAAKVTIKLLQHTPSAKFLSDLHDTQMRGIKAFVPIDLEFRDLINEDTVSARRGFFVDRKKFTRGNGSNDNEFTISFESYSAKLERGAWQ